MARDIAILGIALLMAQVPPAIQGPGASDPKSLQRRGSIPESKAEARGPKVVVPARTLEGLRGSRSINAVDISPDGLRVVSGGEDCRLRSWDAITGRPLREATRGQAPIYTLAFSPGGSRLVVGGSAEIEAVHRGSGVTLLQRGGLVQAWDSTARRPIRTLMTGVRRIRAVHFNANGDKISIIDSSYNLSIIRFSDGGVVAEVSGGPTEGRGAEGPGADSFSSDGRRAAALNDQTIPDGFRDPHAGHFVRVWDAGSGRARFVEGSGGRIRSVALSRDGKLIALGSQDYTLTIRDFETGDLVRQFKAHTERSPTFLTFNPGARRLLSGSGDGVIRVWDVTGGGLERTIAGPVGQVRDIAFLGDALRVVTGGPTPTESIGGHLTPEEPQPLRVWDVTTDPHARHPE